MGDFRHVIALFNLTCEGILVHEAFQSRLVTIAHPKVIPLSPHMPGKLSLELRHVILANPAIRVKEFPLRVDIIRPLAPSDRCPSCNDAVIRYGTDRLKSSCLLGAW